MQWDAKKRPGVIGPGNFPHWMSQDQRNYYTWLRTAEVQALWQAVLDWVHVEGQDRLDELVSEREDRGYGVHLTSQRWYVYDVKTGKPLEAFKSRP